MADLKLMCVLGITVLPKLFALTSAACCLPNQWSASLLDTTGEYNRDLDSASLAYGMRQYFYDYTGKQAAYMESLDNRTAHVKTETTMILKYNEGMKYTIINKTCTSETISQKMESPCIPDNAVFFGAHSYPTGIKAQVWFIPNKITGGSRRLTVTADDCFPLSESSISGGPDYIMRSSLFQNVTEGIIDPKVFNVPASCKHPVDNKLYYKKQTAIKETEDN